MDIGNFERRSSRLVRSRCERDRRQPSPTGQEEPPWARYRPRRSSRPRRCQSPLPPRIQEALGELVGAAGEGLLALSVGVGLSVVHELMELEVAEVVAPKGTHDPDRWAVRHGHQDGSMRLGGRRVPVKRPRVRTADGASELSVAAYEYFAD